MRIVEAGQSPAIFRACVAHEIVGGLGRGFVLGEDAAALFVEHRHHRFVGSGSGLEDALAFSAAQVHAVEEGVVSRIRGAGACEEDPVPILDDERLAARAAAGHRRPRVVVSILRVALPDQPGLGLPGQVYFPGPNRVGAALGFGQQRQPVFSSGESRKAEFGSRDFLPFSVEGRPDHHQPVAMVGCGAGVTPVERLDPHQGVVFRGHPAVPARALLDAPDRRSVPERQGSYVGHDLALPAPHLQLLRETRVRHKVGERANRPFRQDELPARRRVQIPDSGFRQRAHGSGGSVHQRRLGGGVVLVQRRAVGILDQVLVGPHGGGPSFGFLDDRPAGDGRRDGCGPAARRDQGTEQLLTSGHPAARAPPHAVEKLAGEPAGTGGGHASHPQLDPAGNSAGDGEAIASGGETAPDPSRPRARRWRVRNHPTRSSRKGSW